MSCILGLAAALSHLPTASARESYPPYVTDKKLYAERDLRGQSGPRLLVEEWLSGKAPKLENKVVLFDFWATWCPPCRTLIPELNQFQEKFADDLVVVGITDEKPDVVREFMKATKMKYSVATDSTNRMSDHIGIKNIPHVVIVTPDDVVRWQGFPSSSEDPLSEETIAQIISAYKSNNPVKAKDAKPEEAEPESKRRKSKFF